MHFMDSVTLSPLTIAAFGWIKSQPVLVALLALNFLDILTGLAAAFITKSVSSKISARGMTRKILYWLVVGLAAVIDQFTMEIPETKIAALFYCMTEGLSIIENVVRAGLPVPDALRDVLLEIGKQGRSGRITMEQSGKASITASATVEMSGDDVKIVTGKQEVNDSEGLD